MLAQRLGDVTQKNPAFIAALISKIKENPGCCDEVWLTSDYGFPPLSKHAESAALLGQAAKKFREVGIRVSIQLSNSLGHGDYMAQKDCSGLVYNGSPVQGLVGHDGTTAGYCFCWNGKALREYVCDELRLYVKSVKPHTVWIDDDLRATNHAPVSFGCFCDGCIEKFNRRHYADFTRNELVEAINADVKWRQSWIDFVREGLADFTYEICRAISLESPTTAVGLQNGANGGYSGSGNGFLIDAIERATGQHVPYRPGAGAYGDRDPGEFISKAEYIAYQCSLLPRISEIRPEIENLPDVVYGKSIGGTCFETSYYFSDGANAMSYAMLMQDYEPMEWHGKMLKAFAAHRPYWEKLCEVNRRSAQVGLKAVFPKTGFLRTAEQPFEWAKECIDFAKPLRFINIPVTFEQGEVFLLGEQSALGLTDAEIDELLHKPVLAEGKAAAVLYKRGLLPVGAEPVKSRASERFTAHAVNGSAAGRSWGGRWKNRSDYYLTGDLSNAEVLSNYFSANGNLPEDGKIASAVITTKYGAKWAVFGFDFGNDAVSTEVRNRYLNACEYISGIRFASELITPIRAAVSARENKDGRTVTASFTNLTVGDSGEAAVIIRRPAGRRFILMGQYIPTVELASEPLGGDEYRLTIPNIKAWSVASVFCE